MGRKVANPIGIQVFNFLSGEIGSEWGVRTPRGAGDSAVRRFFLRLEDRRRLAGFGDVALLGLQRQVAFGPADDALAHLHGVVAGLVEGLGRHRGAVAAAAIHGHRLLLVELGEPLREIGQRHVGSAGDAARLPLVLGADVDQLRSLVDHLASFLAGDLAGPARLLWYLCHQSTSVPSIKNATRTWARYSSRFSPRIPVETMSTARMLRSDPCACSSACLAASSVEVLELPTSSMIFTTAISILLVAPRWSPWRRRPPSARLAARRGSAAALSRLQRRTRPRTGRLPRRQPRPRLRERSSVPPLKPSSQVELAAAATEQQGEVAHHGLRFAF